jgi:Mrp family chromosome partitioning ATPase
MSALDQAFIKAYADAPAMPVPSLSECPSEKGTPPPRHEPISYAVAVPIGSGPKLAHPTAETSPMRLANITAPLSAFATTPRSDEADHTGLEIDELAWPHECCEMLERASRGWNRFTDRLARQIAKGETCIALASCNTGEGRTTAVLATAKHLATRGIRPAVVDADFEAPTIAQYCRITPHAGWTEVVDGDRSLAEALITTAANDITLVPCRGRAQRVAQPEDHLGLAATFDMLRERCDIVLLDTARLTDAAAIAALVKLGAAIRLDAVYMVRNARTTSDEQLADTSASLRDGGLEVAGTIENFVDPANLRDSLVHIKVPEFAGRWLARSG